MTKCRNCGKEILDEPVVCAECIKKIISAEDELLTGKKPKKDSRIWEIIFMAFFVVLMVWAIFSRTCRFLDHPPENEAKTNLGAIYTTQVAYFSERNTYGAWFDLINWAPQGQSRYTYFLAKDKIENIRGGIYCRELPLGIKAEANENSFAAIASANIDSDTTCDVWSIDSNKKLRHLINDHEE